MKRLKTLLAFLLVLLSIGACTGEDTARMDTATSVLDPAAAPWQEVVERAEGSEVRFYMYGGFAHVNRWIDTWLAPQMKERYGVIVVRQPMDAPVFVNKLVTEKQAGRERGSIDLLWVNGENFRTLKESDALYGPYAERLPNFVEYVDPTLAGTDFGYPVEGYETPYGQAQFVYEYDSATTTPPVDFPALLAWAREHPGRFTYPQPPDFTGSAFIRQAFYALTGGHEQYMDGFDQELFNENAPRLWEYLNQLAPHLWQQGRAYPKGSAELDTLLARGEVEIGMSYHPLHAQSKILDGSYPETVRTFILGEGAIFNLHFTAIPFNSPNKAGAMVLANFLMSPEAQLSKFQPENWGDFPAIDLTRLDASTREEFAALDLGQTTLAVDVLSEAAVPEIPAPYVEALERGWEEHVLHAGQ